MNAPLKTEAKPALSTPLALHGVSKSYGGIRALKPLDLLVPEGEMLAVLGPSGCGKTTTLRIVAGFEAPDTGSVLIGDKDVTDLPPNKRALGMMFQNYSLFPHMNVGENVAYGLKMRGMNRADREKRVRAMLALVRLEGTEDRAIGQLSGGQQQRIALARALAPEPRILLLDEPLGALDKNLREGMQFELRQIQHKLGITSIMVTHDQEEALTMSDRVAVMSAGEVVQSGPPTDVYEHPRNRFVAEFLGTANIFRATAKEQVEGGWRVALDGLGGAEGIARSDQPLAPGQSVLIAVRPERLAFVQPAQGAIRCALRDLVFRGATFAYELRAPGRDAPIVVYTQVRSPVSPGEEVGLTWQAGAAVVLQDQP